MTDRHLFRGKRLDNGEWVQGSLLDGSNMCDGWALICPKVTYSTMIEADDDDAWREKKVFALGAFVHVDSATIGQYTGLKDKDGTLIFEGDILTLEDCHGKRTVEIRYHGGVYYYRGDGFSDEYIFNSHNREVVGNIHDHLELPKRGGT